MTIGLWVNKSLQRVEIERFANFQKPVEKIQFHASDFKPEDQRTDFLRTDSPDEAVFQVINGICDVWNELSYGYSESVYSRALEFELGIERFSFDVEPEFDVFFEGQPIGKQKIQSVLNSDIWVVLTSTTTPRKGLERKSRSIVNQTSISCAICASRSGKGPKIQIIQ